MRILISLCFCLAILSSNCQNNFAPMSSISYSLNMPSLSYFHQFQAGGGISWKKRLILDLNANAIYNGHKYNTPRLSVYGLSLSFEYRFIRIKELYVMARVNGGFQVYSNAKGKELGRNLTIIDEDIFVPIEYKVSYGYFQSMSPFFNERIGLVVPIRNLDLVLHVGLNQHFFTTTDYKNEISRHKRVGAEIGLGFVYHFSKKIEN